MAQKRILQLVDDLDGGSADETVVFALDGREYEIDLSSTNAHNLRKTISVYQEAGRRSVRRPSRSATPARRGSVKPVADDSRAIREWAAQNGHQVNKRGRIPAHVRAAYESR